SKAVNPACSATAERRRTTQAARLSRESMAPQPQPLMFTLQQSNKSVRSNHHSRTRRMSGSLVTASALLLVCSACSESASSSEDAGSPPELDTSPSNPVATDSGANGSGASNGDQPLDGGTGSQGDAAMESAFEP